MADIDFIDEGEGCEGERGERGKRGKRGPRGHDGADGTDGLDGPTGPTGPAGIASNTGATGPAGPTGATGADGPLGFPPVIAAATVQGGLSVYSAQTGFINAGPDHPAAGQYALHLASPPADLNNIVAVVSIIGSSGNSGEISWSINGTDEIDVFTFLSNGTATDQNFSIVVYDLT